MTTKKHQSSIKSARQQATVNNNRLQDEASIQKLRVIQPNLVFVNGLSSEYSQKQVLETEQYFGRYGKVLKTIINPQTPYKKNCTYQAYVTYDTQLQASLAIVALDGFKLYSDRPLKVSFGTTKYCMNFLRGHQCLNSDCFYLHQIDRKRQVINGDPRNTIFRQQNYAAFDTIIANLQQIVKISLEQNVSIEHEQLQGFPTVTQVIQFLIDSKMLKSSDVDKIKKKNSKQKQSNQKNSNKNSKQTKQANKNGQMKNSSAIYDQKTQKRQHSPVQPKLVKSNSFSTTCSPVKTQELSTDQISSVVWRSQLQQPDINASMGYVKQQAIKLYIKQQKQMMGIRQMQVQQKSQKMIVKCIIKNQKELKSRFQFANKAVNNKQKSYSQESDSIVEDCKIVKRIVQRHLLAKN